MQPEVSEDSSHGKWRQLVIKMVRRGKFSSSVLFMRGIDSLLTNVQRIGHIITNCCIEITFSVISFIQSVVNSFLSLINDIDTCL